VHETVILERDDLPTGYAAEGPLVIEESTTTSLIHPGQMIEIDRYGNLLVHVAARTREGG
jgi:N-methylhydantoinase A